MRTVNIFFLGNDHQHKSTQNLQMGEGIMLIFVSEKNRPLLLAKGEVGETMHIVEHT